MSKQQSLFGDATKVNKTKYGEFKSNDNYVWKEEPIYEERVAVTSPNEATGHSLNMIIPGIPVKDNDKGDPMAKQSDRNMVQRTKNGDVFTYRNKKTGKLDVIQRHYQPAKITNSKDAYVLMLQNYFRKHKISTPIFSEYVCIEKLHFVFSPLKSFSKKEMNLIENGIVKHKTTKPDLDNIMKFWKDVLQEAGVYTNDSIVFQYKDVMKVYGLEPLIIMKLKGK